MKIIGKDAYNRDHVNDILVCTNVLERYIQIITDVLNKGATSDYFYTDVPDDYELYKFEP